MIYSQKKKVNASLCGADAKLSVLGALNLIEDSLTEFMGELKIDGITAMKEYNAVIVFVKNHIKFFKQPNWNKDIIVESFMSSKAKARFYIDTVIKDENEKICIYSRIELCALDLNTKKLRRSESVGVNETIEIENQLCDIEFNNHFIYETKHLEDVLVRASNIDYVHHTNNIEYIRFIINTFSVQKLLDHSLQEMEIHYLNQSFEGDKLSIYSNEMENNSYFEIHKGEEPVLKCLMVTK